MVTGVKFYDDNARAYISSRPAYHEQRFRIFNLLIPPGPGRLFDFGCGSADNLLILARQGFSVAGVDPAPRLIEQERAALREAGLDPDAIRVGDVSALDSIDDGSVDVLAALNVLPYLTQAEEDRFFRAASRVVRRGGALVFSVGNALSDLVTFNRYTVEFYQRHVLPVLAETAQEQDECLAHLQTVLTNHALPPKTLDASYAGRRSSERDVVETRRVVLPDFSRRLKQTFGLVVDDVNYFHFWPLPPQILEQSERLMALKLRFGELAHSHALGIVFASQINVRVRL